MGRVRELFNAKLAKMSPEERAFSDDALIDAIDEALEELISSVKEHTLPKPVVIPTIKITPPAAEVTKGK